MEWEFNGVIIEWRGPAPFLFITTPPDVAAEIKDISPHVTYGWGCIPATATIGDTEITTALFPKNGGYLVPVKVAAQRAENIGIGDTARVRLFIDLKLP
ncbi:MAG: DUF1905 domain-containing protein [Armatimonadetes bacterium]|nr:DUF1905 domain-containing protein [Armatimonadota bacterium]